MPKTKVLEAVQDVFHICHLGDDFTFYLTRETSKDNTDSGLASTLKARLEFLQTDGASKEFSFSERIVVLSLALTADSLAADEGRLGKELVRIKKLFRSVSLLQPLLKQLKSSENLRTDILNALNSIINGPSLEKEKWVTGLASSEKDFLKSLEAQPTTVTKWRNRLLLETTFPQLLQKTVIRKTRKTGRALFCLTNRGNNISVTFRRLKDKSGFEAGSYSKKGDRSDNLFSIGEYCDQIYREVFKSTQSVPHAKGLLVITGSTNSAKSEITRGLINLHLKEILLAQKENPGRKPHLITFEDPIERSYGTWLDSDRESFWNVANLTMDATEIDYTPREKGKDVDSLEIALEDALRQTPSVFFVGETREKTEWNLLLDFAATGHLVVTTAHAGSLVEAMHKIFEARSVKTSGDRSEVANKLLGVVHLGREKISFDENNRKKVTNALFPTLWRRTPRGIAALTSNGLASLLPHYPSGGDAPSCLGRKWLVECLLRNANNNGPPLPISHDILAKKINQYATIRDLQGV